VDALKNVASKRIHARVNFLIRKLNAIAECRPTRTYEQDYFCFTAVRYLLQLGAIPQSASYGLQVIKHPITDAHIKSLFLWRRVTP
jgi:hypothetical protein